MYVFFFNFFLSSLIFCAFGLSVFYHRSACACRNSHTVFLYGYTAAAYRESLWSGTATVLVYREIHCLKYRVWHTCGCRFSPMPLLFYRCFVIRVPLCSTLNIFFNFWLNKFTKITYMFVSFFMYFMNFFSISPLKFLNTLSALMIDCVMIEFSSSKK